MDLYRQSVNVRATVTPHDVGMKVRPIPLEFVRPGTVGRQEMQASAVAIRMKRRRHDSALMNSEGVQHQVDYRHMTIRLH